jgi:ABC-2 type transport system ATP-binding protein
MAPVSAPITMLERMATTLPMRLAGVRSAESRGNSVVVSFEGSVNALLRAAIDHNVVNVNSREADLEQIFLTYYHDGEPDAA